jgi:chromate transporter
LTSWVTFVPSFLFILAGAPFIERLAASPRARTILDTVTAAILLGLQLVIALLLAGVLLITGHFHVEGALRILHIIGLLTATGVLLTIPRAARIVAAQS